MHTKTVDVIIPTHKPGHVFSELLKRLRAQDMPAEHVMVVNTEEAFWDPQFEQDYPGLIVRHIAREEFDHGGTRHRMALESGADLLLFMTQDALPADRHLIAYLAEQFGTSDAGKTEEAPADAGGAEGTEPAAPIAAAYARQLPRLDCSVLEKYTRLYNYPAQSRIKTAADLDTLGIKAFFCSNVCAMYDRRVYLACGGFPQHTIFNEDMIFARGLLEAGYGISYVAGTRVIHSHNYTGAQQLHRNFDLAVSQAQNPEVFRDVPSEGEGIRMIRQTAARLCRAGRPWTVFPLIWQSTCKYAGYSLGKHYRLLPKPLVRRLSQNKAYWD